MENDINANLKILRLSRKLSQKKVAEFLNISQSAYARIENGQSNSWSSYYIKICELYNISPDQLFKEATLVVIHQKKHKQETIQNLVSELTKINEKTIIAYFDNLENNNKPYK